MLRVRLTTGKEVLANFFGALFAKKCQQVLGSRRVSTLYFRSALSMRVVCNRVDVSSSIFRAGSNVSLFSVCFFFLFLIIEIVGIFTSRCLSVE